MLLVIDNYDSFTWNLVHYLGELGAEPVVIRNDKITVENALGREPEAIVMSPGPCTPNEAGICLDLIRAANGSVPLFGVCLGHQAIGQAYGGTIVRAPSLMHGKLSTIEHEGAHAPGFRLDTTGIQRLPSDTNRGFGRLPTHIEQGDRSHGRVRIGTAAA